MGQTARIYEFALAQSKEEMLVARRRQEHFDAVDAYLADGGSFVNAEHLLDRLKEERHEYISELFIRKAARKLERTFRNIQATMYDKLLDLVGTHVAIFFGNGHGDCVHVGHNASTFLAYLFCSD